MTETTNAANETITDSKILLTSYEAAEFLHISSLEKYINDLEAQSVM